MHLCILCRFETELDDVAVRRPSGRCICLRCYTRETESLRPMTKQLRRELVTTLAALDAA